MIDRQVIQNTSPETDLSRRTIYRCVFKIFPIDIQTDDP